MSDLVVIAVPTEAKAEEVRQKLLSMQKEYLLELGDAVVAVKDNKGHIKLDLMINTTAAGAVGGAFWGALIGLIFLMPLAGAALGAAGGAVGGALTDLGINDKFMKDTAARDPARDCGAVRAHTEGHRGQGARGPQGRGRHSAEDLARSHEGSGPSGGFSWRPGRRACSGCLNWRVATAS